MTPLENSYKYLKENIGKEHNCNEVSEWLGKFVCDLHRIGYSSKLEGKYKSEIEFLYELEKVCAENRVNPPLNLCVEKFNENGKYVYVFAGFPPIKNVDDDLRDKYLTDLPNKSVEKVVDEIYCEVVK